MFSANVSSVEKVYLQAPLLVPQQHFTLRTGPIAQPKTLIMYILTNFKKD